MSNIVATHVVEKYNGYWNVSRVEDRTYTTSGRARGWRFITDSKGNARYVLRMEEGVMVARTVKVVAVETEWGDRKIQVNPRFAVISDDLPVEGHVFLIGRRCGYLSWFPGSADYNGSNIDGGVIHKVYVSTQQRRKGIATSMFNHARELFPEKDIRHSNALSADGAAFAAATPTPNDLHTAPRTENAA